MPNKFIKAAQWAAANPRLPQNNFPSPPHGAPITLDVGPAATERAFTRLGRNKGVGPDNIAAEVLQAGDNGNRRSTVRALNNLADDFSHVAIDFNGISGARYASLAETLVGIADSL